MFRQQKLLGIARGSSSFTRHPRTTAFTSSLRSLSSNYESQSVSTASSNSNKEPLLGGDFAGLAATFSPIDGSLIDIPIHLIPEAMLEWGQEPKCLEILVSEDFANNQELQRTTLTVLPETGCGIDNLDTQKSKDTIELSSADNSDNKNVIALQYSTTSRDDNLRMETIFGIDDTYRMRVVLDLIPNDEVFAIQSPMLVTKERRTSMTSTSGTRADGGGLDGRTVSQLLGDELRRTPTFAEETPSQVSEERNSIRYVYLPHGITLAYGWTPEDEWVLQVGKEANGVRRVVARKFVVVEGQEQLDFDVESWEEDVV